MAPAGRVMVIFSLGGLLLQRHLRGGAVRCRTGFLPLDGPPRVTLDPFPQRRGLGIMEDGWARLVDDGTELARRRVGEPNRMRWDDLDLLGYAGTTLWMWVALPLRLDDPTLTVRALDGQADHGVHATQANLRRLEVEPPAGWPGSGRRHVLHVDGDGRVHRHEEGNLVHHLSGHCDFGGAELATVRRSRLRGRQTTVAWGDVVAAHLLPTPHRDSKSFN